MQSAMQCQHYIDPRCIVLSYARAAHDPNAGGKIRDSESETFELCDRVGARAFTQRVKS